MLVDYIKIFQLKLQVNYNFLLFYFGFLFLIHSLTSSVTRTDSRAKVTRPLVAVQKGNLTGSDAIKYENWNIV